MGFGYDASKDEYADMIERGIIDPTKVTRSALQNAASVAAMLLTTEIAGHRYPRARTGGPGCCRRRHGRHVLSKTPYPIKMAADAYASAVQDVDKVNRLPEG